MTKLKSPTSLEPQNIQELSLFHKVASLMAKANLEISFYVFTSKCRSVKRKKLSKQEKKEWGQEKRLGNVRRRQNTQKFGKEEKTEHRRA